MLQEVLAFEFHRIVFEKVTVSDRKGANVSENLDFWWYILQKVLVDSVPGMTPGSVFFFKKQDYKGFWGHWGCWGSWGSKVWKMTTEDFRVIQFLKFSFILMLWKRYFFWYNHEISYGNLAPISVGGCWGQPILVWLANVTLLDKSTYIYT